MSNIRNNGENDQPLKDGLETLGDAYRQLQPEEPPELLDQAILNSAHRAVEKKAHWTQFGWLHGLTTTAVFVLALSLIFLQREQAPVLEDGLRVDESIGLQRERATSTPSRDAETDDHRMEMKEAGKKRQDVFQNLPVSEPSPGEAMEQVAGEQALKAEAGKLSSSHRSEPPRDKLHKTDEDANAIEPIINELRLEEQDSVADTLEAEDLSGQVYPATVTAPAASEAKVITEDVSEIDQLLQDIIKLKRSGDEAWLTELASFRQAYPDYPIPDELLN
jgi:hypothetical protein